MKKILSLIVMLIMITPVLAYDSEIKQLADIIDRNTNTTFQKVQIVEVLVDNMIQYEFNYRAKGITRTWDDKTGDCTDRAMLKQYMLGRMDVPARLVHGYNNNGIKHDWYQYQYNNLWYSSETDSIKRGYGVW